jgi:hypothetical protein
MEHLAGDRFITMVVNQVAHQVVEYGTFDTGPFNGQIRGENCASAINELRMSVVEHKSLLCCTASVELAGMIIANADSVPLSGQGCSEMAHWIRGHILLVTQRFLSQNTESC